MTENGKPPFKRSLLVYFIMTFIFTWSFWSIGILISHRMPGFPLPPILWVIIGAHGPLVASFWLKYKSGGRSALTAFIRSGFQLRMKFVWWAAIIIVPVVIAGLAVIINMTAGDYAPEMPLFFKPLLILGNLVFMFFLGGSVQEEFGWRGYALPKLLSLTTPFSASLVLGFIWGIWHLPLFFIPGLSQSYMSISVFLLLTVAFSFIFTWMFIKTDFNLFSALLLHTTINTSLNIFPTVETAPGGDQAAFTYLMILYVLSVIILVARDRKFWFAKLSSQQK